jgi:hypothetical protein
MLDSKGLGGFTIIEVLLFLTISGFLLVTAIHMFGGQSGETAFSEGVREVYSQLQALSNNVSTGFYTNTNNFSCTPGTEVSPGVFSSPTITYAASNNQGTQKGCEFLGQVVQFAPSNETNKYVVYTVVGNQFVGNSTTVTTDFTEAVPTALIYASDISNPTASATDSQVTLPAGIQVKTVSYADSTTTGNNASYTPLIGFFSSFQSYTNGNPDVLNSGSEGVNLIPVAAADTEDTASCDPSWGSVTGLSESLAVQDIDSLTNASSSSCGGISTNRVNHGITTEDPSDGVSICLQSGNQYAQITIGGDSGPLTSNLIIYNGGQSC